MNPFNTNNNNNNKQNINQNQFFNPMQQLEMLAQQDPNAAQALMILRNGGNPEQLVRQICKQRGINVDEFMKQFR